MVKKVRYRKKPGRKSTFKDEYYVKAYRLAKSGLKDSGIARCLGIPEITFYRWMRTNPTFKSAIRDARKSEDGEAEEKSFADYVYNRLPRDLKAVWDRIRPDGEDTDEMCLEELEAILKARPVLFRKRLYIQALVHCNFNASEASRLTGVSKRVLDSWMHSDPDFKTLWKEIHWHKKNFFEACLVDLARRGDPGAIIHANKTLNRDRGYGEKVDIHTTGEMRHTVRVEDMNLSLEEKRALLQKIRDSKEPPRLEDRSQVQDAEFTVKKDGQHKTREEAREFYAAHKAKKKAEKEARDRERVDRDGAAK